MYVDSVFNNVVHHNGGSYMLASLIFPFQIYGDFAGYSLTAIGAARVMGFHLMDNFHRPYLSKTVTEFWHRWHISLSTWFKDYVYIPLGGNRVNTPRCYANILITFVVSGIWHGANWTFLAWGTIHGTLQCIEKWFGWNKAKWNVATRFIHWLATFCIVALAWVFFRANTLADATTVLSGIFTQLDKPFMLTNTEMALILFGIFAVFIKDCADEFKWPIAVAESKFWLVRHLYIVFMIAFIVMFGVLNGSQFIYFQF